MNIGAVKELDIGAFHIRLPETNLKKFLETPIANIKKICEISIDNIKSVATIE